MKMPNRMVRESLLDSPRYLSVDEGAQLLYDHLLLLADDFGCVSIAYSFIGRRCFSNRPSDDRLDLLIGQLAEADLVRLYDHRGMRFAFIPRFRQRLKRETLKHPQPPDELLLDDLDAQEKFKKLNGHDHEGAAGGRPEGRPRAALGRLKGREEKGSEEKGSEEKLNLNLNLNLNPLAHSLPRSASQFALFWAQYPKKKSKGTALKAWQAIKPDAVLVQKILGALQLAVKSAEWLKEGGTFIPYPAKWLRARGWEDEQREAGPNSKTAQSLIALEELKRGK